MAVEGYVTELIKFRNPLLPRHLPPGLSKDLRDLSKSMEVLAKRARRVWNKLPPGLTGGAAALEQWRQDTLKLAKALNEGNWLPKNSGKWNVVDEIIWGLLKLLEQITGRYHYPEVAELATLCLDDPNNRCNVAALKMLVNRRKPRERNFLPGHCQNRRRSSEPDVKADPPPELPYENVPTKGNVRTPEKVTSRSHAPAPPRACI